MWGVLEKSAVILAKARISLGVSEIAVSTAMTEYGFYSPQSICVENEFLSYENTILPLYSAFYSLK